MDRIIEKSVIGASLVFTINHILFYIVVFIQLNFELSFVLNGELALEGTIFGMFYNIVAFPIFIIINGIIFTLIHQRFPNWSMTVHVIIMFLLANLVLGRIQLGADLDYWLRYCLALPSLFLVNSIVEKFSWWVKLIIILIPFVFTGGIIVAHSNGFIN